MGIFSKLRGAPAVDTTLAKAALMPAVLTMIADGDIDDAEIFQLQNLCAFSPIFTPVGPEKVAALIKELIDDLGKQGIAPLIQSSKALLSPPLRETAVLFAMRIALADGRIDAAEEKSLLALGQNFEIPEAQFMKMFEVVSILQRRPDAA